MTNTLTRDEIEGYIIFLENIFNSLKEQVTEIDDDEKSEFLSNLKEFESDLIQLKNQNYYLET